MLVSKYICKWYTVCHIYIVCVCIYRQVYTQTHTATIFVAHASFILHFWIHCNQNYILRIHIAEQTFSWQNVFQWCWDFQSMNQLLFFIYLSFCFIHKTLSAQSKLVSFPTSHSKSTCRHCNIYINAYIFFQVNLMVNMVYNINNFLYLILITSKAGLIPGSTCITHQGAFFHT